MILDDYEKILKYFKMKADNHNTCKIIAKYVYVKMFQ